MAAFTPERVATFSGIRALGCKFNSEDRTLRLFDRWLVEQGICNYFTDSAYRLMSLLDGERTLEQARSALSSTAEAVPTEELVALIARLQSADLLRYHGPVDPAVLFKRWHLCRRRMLRSAWLRPLAVRASR